MARGARQSLAAPDIQFEDPKLARLMEFVRSLATENHRLQQMIAGGAAAQVLTKQSSGDYDAAWKAVTGGTVTGGKNLGSGVGIFKDLEGANLAFKSLVPGANVSLTQDGSTVTVASVGTVGPQGPVGPVGPAGATGATGATGPTGAQGPLGPALFFLADDGNDGDVGPPGIQGPAGAAGSGGALVKIAEQILGSPAASVTFSSIPQSYRNLILKITYAATVNTSPPFGVQFNGDTGSNYSGSIVYCNVTTGAGGLGVPSATFIDWNSPTPQNAAANQAASLQFTIFDYARAVWNKNVNGTWNKYDSSSSFYVGALGGSWFSNAAINSVTFLLGSGNFVAGSVFSLYGES